MGWEEEEGEGEECSPLNQMEISIKYAARCLRLSPEVSLGKQGEGEGKGRGKAGGNPPQGTQNSC